MSLAVANADTYEKSASGKAGREGGAPAADYIGVPVEVLYKPGRYRY